VCSRGVFVHCPSRLGAAVTILTVEFLGGDRVFTKWTLERAKAVHQRDRVVSHNYVACGFLISDERQMNEALVETEI
jgi:hypothetical protein